MYLSVASLVQSLRSVAALCRCALSLHSVASLVQSSVAYPSVLIQSVAIKYKKEKLVNERIKK